MDVTSWLLRRTTPRPLLITTPGGTSARVAAERHLRERGWRMATSPARANTLIVAGADRRIEDHVRRVWDALPAPRVRVDVSTAEAAEHELAAVPGRLHDLEAQRAEATEDETGGQDGSGTEMPGGVPMADRAEDRDGLALDQLHVPLGPALPLWPAGLIVHTRLQGDVVQHASVELLAGHHGSFWTHRDAARQLDSCHRLLAVAGWEDAATAAQRYRDDVLAGAVPDVRRWAARVRRSRTLRWLLAGVGPTPEGDALNRLHRRLDATTRPPNRAATRHQVDALPALLEGAELATARLIVASLDPDLDLLAAVESHDG